MFKIALNYALRNIVRSKARSVFSVISVALVITLYTILSSIGSVLVSQLPDAMNRAEIDLLVQSKFSSNPLSSRVGISTIDELAVDKDVKYYNSLIIGKKKFSQKASAFIMGIHEFSSFANRTGISIVDGRMFSSKSSNEIIIGDKFAKVMGYSIGEEIELIPDKKYTITGIYSTWIALFNNGILVHLDEAQNILQKPNHVSMLFVSLKDGVNHDNYIESFNAKYKKLQATKSGQLTQTFTSIKNIAILINAITLITLCIAVAVMLNTFIMAVNERTKEIGILSAIGWSRFRIMNIFMIESLLLAWMAGAIGYLSSYPLLMLMQTYFVSLHSYLPSSPEPSIIPTLALITMLIGLISAVIPAFFATKINISKALRHE